LIRLFGPKRNDITGEWRKLHNEVLHNLYSTPDIIRWTKSRRMRWAGHVAGIEKERKGWATSISSRGKTETIQILRAAHKFMALKLGDM
jgi:hypothetical protein